MLSCKRDPLALQLCRILGLNICTIDIQTAQKVPEVSGNSPKSPTFVPVVALESEASRRRRVFLEVFLSAK